MIWLIIYSVGVIAVAALYYKFDMMGPLALLWPVALPFFWLLQLGEWIGKRFDYWWNRRSATRELLRQDRSEYFYFDIETRSRVPYDERKDPNDRSDG